jgi:hypothetical protein
MKMYRREDVESFEELEARAQQQLNPGAVVKAALVVGALIFAVPAGPWMSQEAFVNVMGRSLGTNAWLALIGHFVVAMIYGWVLALCIFRLPLGAGIGFGALLSAPLYALNYVLLSLGAGFHANEIHVGIAHFMFCLFFSAAYRAMAVPKARRKDTGEVMSENSKIGPEDHGRTAAAPGRGGATQPI